MYEKKMKTRQEAQTILNQIAQMRANSKEQESAATAFLSAGSSSNAMDIMDIGHPSTGSVNMSKLLGNNSNGAGKSSASNDNLNAPSTGSSSSGKQLSDELSSSMVLLDKLDAADHPTFGDNRTVSSKSIGGAQAGSNNVNSGSSATSNSDPVNIRISSDSDLESDNYFGEFNIKRFSNKRSDN